MNRTGIIPFFLVSAATLSGCQSESPSTEVHVTLSNPASGSNATQLLQLPVPEVLASANGVTSSDGSLAELIDRDKNGTADTLLLQVSLAPGQQRDISLSASMQNTLPDLAHAELSVRQGGEWQGAKYVADDFQFTPVTEFESPKQLTDHSFYLRYEGPGWESDKMGYRLYLDWRNAIDVFAKTVTTPALHMAGQDGYESYHHMQDWGQDVLKAGKSLGLGALGRWHDGAVVHFNEVDNTRFELDSNDRLQAGFSVYYQGWKAAEKSIDVSTHYQINAGDSATQIMLKSSEPVSDLVVGLVDHGVAFMQAEGSSWGYIATWGKQSLAGEDDQLGLAIFYQKAQVAQQIKGPYDYLLNFAPSTDNITYEILAEWPQAPSGPQNQAEFEAMLRSKLQALDAPIVASLTH